MRRNRLSYANVASTLALFLAAAGGTTAVALNGRDNVDANDIQKGAVAGREVKNEALFKRDLGKGAVGSSELGANSVTGGKITDGTVWSRELGTGAVTAEDVKDGALSGVELTDGTVTGVDVTNGSLGGEDIQNRSVGEPDLAPIPAARIAAVGLNVPDNEVTDVPFTIESGDFYDPLDLWDPADPEVITVPRAGIYVATGLVRWANDNTSGGALLDQGWRLMQMSGGGQVWRTVGPSNRHGTEQHQTLGSAVFNLEAGDEVRLNVAQSNEDASTVQAMEANLGVAWIGPSPGPAG
jgi:hypothetical protein